MLSLSLDAAKDAPRKLIAERGLTWSQGFLGEGATSSVLDAYHVETIPATFLIGPDGVVKAMGLRGERIDAAVAKTLGER